MTLPEFSSVVLAITFGCVEASAKASLRVVHATAVGFFLVSVGLESMPSYGSNMDAWFLIYLDNVMIVLMFWLPVLLLFQTLPLYVSYFLTVGVRRLTAQRLRTRA